MYPQQTAQQLAVSQMINGNQRQCVSALSCNQTAGDLRINRGANVLPSG
jgi:hypothetical protein